MLSKKWRTSHTGDEAFQKHSTGTVDIVFLRLTCGRGVGTRWISCRLRHHRKWHKTISKNQNKDVFICVSDSDCCLAPNEQFFKSDGGTLCPLFRWNVCSDRRQPNNITDNERSAIRIQYKEKVIVTIT
jgi:hypothetical protein